MMCVNCKGCEDVLNLRHCKVEGMRCCKGSDGVIFVKMFMVCRISKIIKSL